MDDVAVITCNTMRVTVPEVVFEREASLPAKPEVRPRKSLRLWIPQAVGQEIPDVELKDDRMVPIEASFEFEQP